MIPNAPKEIPVTWSKWFSPEEMKILDKFLDEELKTGKIWPSKSPYAAACFFIFKKGNKLRRLVQDYQGINEFTIKDKTPLPRIESLIDVLTRGRWFMKMDIIWGYNNVQIKEGHEHKAAFLMP